MTALGGRVIEVTLKKFSTTRDKMNCLNFELSSVGVLDKAFPRQACKLSPNVQSIVNNVIIICLFTLVTRIYNTLIIIIINATTAIITIII